MVFLISMRFKIDNYITALICWFVGLSQSFVRVADMLKQILYNTIFMMNIYENQCYHPELIGF